ncbi:MAG: gliding motility protein GldN [Bacteroidales bacterium]|nr:gliding motility protein GldN [Bacteroidales bacterium]
MKKLMLGLFAILSLGYGVNAQSIVDAEDGTNPNDFYQTGIVVGKRAMPYPYLRESDVVWKMLVWRKIDFNESFNQFFYFPVDQDKNTQGRISLVNLIINAAKNGSFEVYEDDDMKVPQDLEKAIAGLNGQRKTTEYGEEDEFGDVEEKEVISPDPFDAGSVKTAMLKECWYIDKQDTRQKVRIVGLAFSYRKNMVRAGQEEETQAESFWIPMNHMTVRQVLVNANAFDENNDVAERSYDDVFIQRYFDSYITRKSNKFNRRIDEYLTGEDAIVQSQMIEEELFNIESDMWEY